MAAVGVAWVMTSSVFAANVAKIGDTEYATLDAAISAWKEGDTIVLLSDIDSNGYFVKNADFVIDGAGKYTIKCLSPNSNYPNYFVNVASGYKQTFKNVTIDANEKVPYAIQCIGSASALTLDNVTIKGGKSMSTKGKNDSFAQTRLGYGIHVNGGKVVANNLKVQNCTVSAGYMTGNDSNGKSPSFTLSGDECSFDLIGSSDLGSLTPTIVSTAKGCCVCDVTASYKFLGFLNRTTNMRVVTAKAWNNLINQVGSMAEVSVTKASVKLL